MMYRKGLIDGLREQKEIVIYGNGNFALKIREFMDVWKIETVSACLVTRICDAGGKFMGLPVIAIESWKPKTDAPLILIAVRENSQEELMRDLAKRGYHNFLSVNDFLVDVMKD